MHYHYLTIEQRETLERLIRSQGAGDANETLRRLHSPGYGVCRGCGADIPYVRLAAQPAALYCAACESAQ
jgi:RNA polymerase-binding transcription factor DksA